jgi:hypothetical protein
MSVSSRPISSGASDCEAGSVVIIVFCDLVRAERLKWYVRNPRSSLWDDSNLVVLSSLVGRFVVEVKWWGNFLEVRLTRRDATSVVSNPSNDTTSNAATLDHTSLIVL